MADAEIMMDPEKWETIAEQQKKQANLFDKSVAEAKKEAEKRTLEKMFTKDWQNKKKKEEIQQAIMSDSAFRRKVEMFLGREEPIQGALALIESDIAKMKSDPENNKNIILGMEEDATKIEKELNEINKQLAILSKTLAEKEKEMTFEQKYRLQVAEVSLRGSRDRYTQQLTNLKNFKDLMVEADKGSKVREAIDRFRELMGFKEALNKVGETFIIQRLSGMGKQAYASLRNNFCKWKLNAKTSSINRLANSISNNNKKLLNIFENRTKFEEVKRHLRNVGRAIAGKEELSLEAAIQEKIDKNKDEIAEINLENKKKIEEMNKLRAEYEEIHAEYVDTKLNQNPTIFFNSCIGNDYINLETARNIVNQDLNEMNKRFTDPEQNRIHDAYLKNHDHLISIVEQDERDREATILATMNILADRPAELAAFNEVISRTGKDAFTSDQLFVISTALEQGLDISEMIKSNLIQAPNMNIMAFGLEKGVIITHDEIMAIQDENPLFTVNDVKNNPANIMLADKLHNLVLETNLTKAKPEVIENPTKIQSAMSVIKRVFEPTYLKAVVNATICEKQYDSLEKYRQDIERVTDEFVKKQEELEKSKMMPNEKEAPDDDFER